MTEERDPYAEVGKGCGWLLFWFCMFVAVSYGFGFFMKWWLGF